MKASSSRRRTKQEIKDAQVAAQVKAQALADKLKTIERLQQELTNAKAQQNMPSKEQEAFANMLISGFIAKDENGDYVPGEMSRKSEHA